MSKCHAYFDNFYHRFADWLFRRKSKSFGIFKGGVSLIAMTIVGSLMISATYSTPDENLSLVLNTSETGSFFQCASFALGVALTIVGLIGMLISYKEEAKANVKKQIIVIEQRGLRDTSDTPLVDAIPKGTLGQRQSLPIDIRDKLNDGQVTQPEQALNRVLTVNESLSQRCLGHSTSDISVIYGGLLPVPFTFLTGVLLDDERQIEVYDWSRESEAWQSLSEPDDNDRFTGNQDEGVINTDEVVLAVSVSYRVDMASIKLTFPNIPVVELTLGAVSSGNHWSAEKQAALSMQFLEQIKQLSAEGIKQLHLIVAAPNSLVFRLGRVYDKRNLPEAIVYQYERSGHPAYPWGVKLPTHGIETPSIVYRPG